MEHTNSPTRRGHLSKSLPLSVRFASGGGFRRRRRRKIKQALWVNTRESLATLLVVLAHSSTVQKYLSVPAPNGCRNAKARSIRPLQPKRPVWTGTTRETGGHHHASCFWRRTQRKEDHAMRSPSGCLPPCSLHVRYNHSNQTIGVDIKVLSSSALASCYNDA